MLLSTHEIPWLCVQQYTLDLGIVMKVQGLVKQELCLTPCNLCGSKAVTVLANHSRSGDPL
jgi:hypothetical protein